MKLKLIIVFIGLMMFSFINPIIAVSAESGDTMEELKSSYLQSIYDDCRIFLEGIELFIRRDYPRFWPNMEADLPIPSEEISRYSNELKHFEGQLDALYEEYISFKSTSGSKSVINSPLELKIYQMLCYSYMRTGDFGMSYALMKKKNIFSQNYTVKLIDIEGKLSDFQLTKELKNLHQLINSNLRILNLRLKYFFQSDVQAINAYLKMTDYDRESPFNKAYFSYYQGIFTSIGDNSQDIIHFSEIIRFFNRKTYNNVFTGTKVSAKNRQYIDTYYFPIIKGEYGIDLKDNSIMASVSANNNTMNLERLCEFKGFVRTDFRRLKTEEKKNIKNKTLIGKGLYLEKTNLFQDDDATMTTTNINAKKRKLLDYEMGSNTLRIGQMLRYGVYRLFQNGKYLGMVELVPCYKGENCKKRSIDKSITKVNVYNHELTFYQDILDKIQANRRMYGKGNYVSPKSGKARPNSVKKTNGSNGEAKIHVGKGCASGR